MSLVTEQYFCFVTSLQEIKEKVKYTVTTGYCNFCETGRQRGTLQERKEKEKSLELSRKYFFLS